MKLAEKILSEVKQTIQLDGKEYQINIQKALGRILKYTMDNPDMGDPQDFKDDKARLAYHTKQMKGLGVSDAKEQIEILVGEGELKVKDLIKDKVISK
jgi:hypothetical protein